MKLSELLKKLSYGELSNLSLSGEGSGTINESAHPRLILLINDALKDIFSRFNLHERTTAIQSLDWKSFYVLRKEFAVMDPTVGLKYIIDTPSNIFTDDLVKILDVTNEVGDPLPLNDAEQWASVFTPKFDTLQLTHPGSSQIFAVTYQALHPELALSGAGYLDQEIRIPSILETALRMKTVLPIFSAMSGQEYSVKSQQLEAAYENRLAEIEQKNLISDSVVPTNVKLMRRGFP